MEQRSVSAIIEQFLPLLRKFENDENLEILDASEEPGSKAGDNYMSIVVRTKIVGKRGNGEPYKKSFMIKHYPRHREVTEMLRTLDLFFNETLVYDKILPHLGSYGPSCIYTDSKTIIMEDLKERGYDVCERKNCLDLDHCAATLQTLASMHAKSIALKFKDPSLFEKLTAPLKEAVFPAGCESSIGELINGFMDMVMKDLNTIQNPTEELSEMLEFFRSKRNQYYSMMQDFINLPKEKFYVLCHGDTWINNILYKHDSKGKVQDVKLVDFQIARHNDPATDFHYFVYTSATTEVLYENYDDLVKHYVQTLVQELKKAGVPEKEVNEVNVEWFQGRLKKFSMYGLLTGLWLVHAILAEDDSMVNMDTLTKDDLGNLERVMVPTDAKKIERMKQIVLHYKKRYSN